MDWSKIDIWPLLAGLGLFLFGMFMLEEAIKNLAGRSFKEFLRKNTNNHLKAITSGALVTAVLQSSSLVSILVMSLAGAGIIGLGNGIGMIMGANLGTTMTGWLVATIGFKVNIETLIMPFLAIGGLGLAFLKSERLSNFSKLLMGFSLMFLGLNYMKNNFGNLAEQLDISILEGQPSILFCLFGFIFTALIQSSSASMSIYLASLASGIITLPQAAFLVIGSDLGTTITAILGTLKANTIRRKVGFSQFGFNLFATSLAFVFAYPLLWFIKNILGFSDPLTSLVVFHSIFNLLGIIFLMPFINYFMKFLERIVPTKNDKLLKHLNENVLADSQVAVTALEKECLLFVNKVISYNHLLVSQPKETLNDYLEIKHYENEVAEYYVNIQQKSLNEIETKRINSLVATIRNAAVSSKDLKDISHNLQTLAIQDQKELKDWYNQIKENQAQFYQQIKIYIDKISNLGLQELENINLVQNDYYKLQTSAFYRIQLQKDADIDVSTGLNILSEINKSNESVFKALRNFISTPISPT